MKTAIAILLSLAAFANAFTNAPPALGVVGKAFPRLSEQQLPGGRNVVAPRDQSPRDREGVVLHNMLREYANYNDVWDGDYGYGGYGMGRGVYSRRGGGGGYG
jgi:hypothetical protein